MFVLIVGLFSIFAAIFTVLTFFKSRVDRARLRKDLKVSYSLTKMFNDGLLRNFSPNKIIDEYFSKNEILHSDNDITITLENLNDSGSIKLPRFMYLDVLRAMKLPQKTAYYCEPKDGIGGGRETRSFWGVLIPDSKRIQIAGYISRDFHAYSILNESQNSLSVEVDYDYFLLAPGESETFDLFINFLKGYYYEFRVGIPFEANGERSILWINETFVIAEPTSTKYFKPVKIEPFEPGYEHGQLAPNYRKFGIVPWRTPPISSGNDYSLDSLKKLKSVIETSFDKTYPLAVSSLDKLDKPDEEIYESLKQED